MAVKYLDVSGITEACKKFRSTVKEFDECVTEMDRHTNDVMWIWMGKGGNQFQTQMELMKSQLDDISEVLYDICEALGDAEEAYIDADVETAKQISITSAE